VIKTLIVVVSAVGLIASTLAACAPLTAFNALAPADRGARLARADIPYGALPRQKLDVYVPDAPVKSTPVVVIFYGGSWNSGSKDDYGFLGKALASRGFVAIVADYRLVPAVRFPSFLDDAALAIKWARDHAAEFNGDSTQLFLLGHSAGAYIAVMVALDGRYLRAVGADPTMVRGVAGLAGPYDFLPLDVASTVAAFGQEKDLARTQPINFVTTHSPPMFLATGTDDTTVYPRNSFGLANRLKKAGVGVTLKTYTGLGHVDILLAISVTFRGKAPVLDDVASFITATTSVSRDQP
jgi:acetyl esterase/lipase